MSYYTLLYVPILFSTIHGMESNAREEKSKTKNTAVEVLSKWRNDRLNLQRLFKCTRLGCSSDFTKIGQLNAHISRVHGPKKYICAQKNCDKEFSRKYHLKRHKALMHSNERPFVCHICTYDCKLKQYLTKHLKLVHQIIEPAKRAK